MLTIPKPHFNVILNHFHIIYNTKQHKYILDFLTMCFKNDQVQFQSCLITGEP